jgi:hypothetical protein
VNVAFGIASHFHRLRFGTCLFYQRLILRAFVAVDRRFRFCRLLMDRVQIDGRITMNAMQTCCFFIPQTPHLTIASLLVIDGWFGNGATSAESIARSSAI